MYPQEDFLPLSALHHFVFCSRRCALIHIEQIWIENQFTAEGRILHDKAHDESIAHQKGVRVERGMPLRSFELGLSGKADVVEFYRDAHSKKWIPFPVEYKRGKAKSDDRDLVQLCAQALCLEEMLQCTITRGALYYGKTHRRLEVEFTPTLRERTKNLAIDLHKFFAQGKTPLAVYDPKCNSCSFIDICMPKTVQHASSVDQYLKDQVFIAK